MKIPEVTVEVTKPSCKVACFVIIFEGLWPLMPLLIKKKNDLVNTI